MRSSSTPLAATLLALACSREQPDPAAEHRGAEPSPSAEQAILTPTEPAADEAEPSPRLPHDPMLAAPNPEAEPAPEPGPETPADPLAPIRPSGPEPGSPEADAELSELLEESTITQEEFDRAFRGGGPNIHGDQFVFGPNERTRARPVVEIGKPAVSGSSVDPAKLAALAEADQQQFLACHAMALSKDPNVGGSVTLRLELDAGGAVAKVSVEGGGGLGSSLSDCLASIAKRWRLADAAGAKIGIPLTLARE